MSEFWNKRDNSDHARLWTNCGGRERDESRIERDTRSDDFGTKRDEFWTERGDRDGDEFWTDGGNRYATACLDGGLRQEVPRYGQLPRTQQCSQERVKHYDACSVCKDKFK